MVTAVALLIVAVLALLGTTAVVITSTDLLIGGNYKVSEQAFYAAEAGVEEARSRLRGPAGKISDTGKEEDTNWKAYIGTVGAPSLQSQPVSLKYVVEIRHKLDPIDPTKVMKTAAGNNIYLVTSTGSTGNSNRTVEAQIAKTPPISLPAALYVKGEATITGNATVEGKDKCLPAHDKQGVATTSPKDSVEIQGSGNVTGTGGTGQYAIDYGIAPLDIDNLVSSLKSFADPGMQYTSGSLPSDDIWGQPTTDVPPTCTHNHVIYFKGSILNLGGGSTPKSGCGLLLVEGNLTIDGTFSWHGLIIVTGALIYKGTGNKALTGGMLVGGTADADLTGTATILNCSSAVANATAALPMRTLSWKDLRSAN